MPTSAPAASTAAVPAPPMAIAAFVRGVSRRAVVFAELQAGDPVRGDAVVAAALRAFRAEAPALELARWPEAFWSRLANAPALRGAAAGEPDWAALPPGPRAALLLRLAAGLDEAAAARVLAVGVPAYRLALQRALAAGGAVDGLHASVQARIAALPAARLERLAGAPSPVPAERAGPAAARPRAPRAVRAVLWALLLLCALAFALTFRAPPAPAPGASRPEPLPPAAPPASGFAPEAAGVVHPDFALLVDADAAPFVRDLEFLAWLAAGADGTDAAAVRDAAPVALPGATGLETDDAPL